MQPFFLLEQLLDIHRVELNMMQYVLPFLILLGILVQSGHLQAQNSKLANQYYLEGEYEKAADIYEKLYQTSNRSDYFFTKYIECLLALEEYDRSENVIRGQLKEKPGNVNLYVTLGNVLERQNRFDEADLNYQESIKNLPRNPGSITKLGNAFTTLTKYDLAIQTFEKGEELLKKKGIFSYNLADLYRRKSDIPKMVEQYLLNLQTNPKRITSVQSLFQRYLKKEDYAELQAQLYGLIQENPDADYYPEMLAWTFIQKKDYQNALRQVRALDKRLDENGHRVFNLGQIAANAGEYDVAIAAFDYIVENKGANSTFYMESKRQALANKRNKVVKTFDYTVEELKELEAEYESFLDLAGRNKTTAPIIAELARFEAFYMNDLEKAITLLDNMINYPGVNKRVKARAKINLADYYLMQGEIWEATLLYSQVDKEFREDLLGQEARFTNAKLSYYAGDFEWAQTQFDVLKASTSKLIANDALDLSIFIMDNLGLDTTDHPMILYAEADLLVFQNRFEEAFEKLNLLYNLYTDHGLIDDILYLKAQIFVKRREVDQAIATYEQILNDYPDEIRADNALFELAELYETKLGQPEKAMPLYEKLFIEYSGSTFSIEARKRFRTLRGDFGDEPLN